MKRILTISYLTIITIALTLMLILSLTSCSSSAPITHQPTRKEINRAMKHSDWRYRPIDLKEVNGKLVMVKK